jgi:Cu/Ag efflux protein CusF
MQPEFSQRNLRMSIFKTIIIVALFSASTVALAADDKAALEKPSLFTSQTIKVNAVVEAIDHETRVVTLRKPDGEMVTFTASDEARNLGQVEVGDIVNAEYVQSISIKVMADDGRGPGAGELGIIERTAEGEMPGAAIIEAQFETAVVEAIDLEANTFKLRYEDGTIDEYTARDPDNLRRSEVGDLVMITIAESVAISVEQGPAQ